MCSEQIGLGLSGGMTWGGGVRSPTEYNNLDTVNSDGQEAARDIDQALTSTMEKTCILYTYFRSSCSARVRIAAHFKGIKLEYKFIHLLKYDQKSPAYASVNPSLSVPTLVIKELDKDDIVIRQSIAILEYFEEAFADTTPLLPKDSANRAKVRELVNVVACDIQPVTNLRVLDRIRPAGLEVSDWQQHFMTAGLRAYEALALKYAGRFSVGDEVSMADVVLAPAVDGALRFGVDIAQFPTIARLAKQYEQVDAFRKGSWRAQEDTPEELRSGEVAKS